MQLKKIISFIIIAVTALPLSMKAQITTGSLSGNVKDDEGKSLAGASITALYNPSNIRYATSSSRTGSYNISNMRPGGPYTITVSYVGHDAQTYNDVYIQLAEATVLDPKLAKTNAQLQSVTVVSNARNTIAVRSGVTAGNRPQMAYILRNCGHDTCRCPPMRTIRCAPRETKLANAAPVADHHPVRLCCCETRGIVKLSTWTSPGSRGAPTFNQPVARA